MNKFTPHFLATLGLGLLAATAAHAQTGIGTGATPPRTGTMLDVNGPLAVYETTVAATGTTAPTAAITGSVGQVQLTTGSATAGPITVSYAGTANSGQRLVIYNAATYAATFNNQSIPAGQAVEFVYSNSGWRAGGDGGNSVTATNGLTKTGNNVALGGALTGATTISNISSANTLSFTSPTPADAAITVGSTVANAGRVNLGNTNHGIQRGLTSSTGGAGNDVAVYTSQANLYLVANPNTTGNTSLPLGQFTLTPTGNVGIGTATPGTKLDVVGNARISTLATGATADQLVTAGSDGTLNQRTAASVLQGATTNTLTNTNGSLVSTVNGVASAANPVLSDAQNGLTDTNGVVRLGGALTQATSVSGITSATPLSFTSPTAADAAITVGSTASGSGKIFLGNPNHGIQRDLTGSTGGLGNDVALYTTNSGGGRLFLAANSAVTGNTNLPLGQFTLLSNGNVGIGTVAPSTSLQVIGNTKIGGDAVGNVQLVPGSATQAGYMGIYAGNGTTRLGYIGYNNTDLAYVLDNAANHSFTGPVKLNTLATGATADQLVTAAANGTLNQRTAASVLAGATTNTLSNTNGTLTSTVSGVAATTPVLIDANNGLTDTNGVVQLGGALTQATNVSGITSTNTLSFTSPTSAAAAITVGSAGGAGRLQLGNPNHGIQRDLTGSTGGAGNDMAVYTSLANLYLVANPSATGNTSLPLGQFTLNTSGWVGIGSTSPVSKLHLLTTGGSGGADDDYNYDTYTGNGTSASGIYYRHARGTAAAPANLANGDLLYTQSGTGYVNGAFAGLTFLNSYYTGNGTTSASYMNFGTGGTERLRITENGAIRMNSYGSNGTANGLVTTAPNAYLAVSADGTIMQTANGNAPNIYTVDGSIINDRTVTLAGHTINFLGSTGNFQFNATGNTFSTSANQLVMTETGDQYGSASISLRNRNGQNGLLVTTANQTTGQSQVAVTDLFLQTQSGANGYKQKQMNVRLESRISPAYILGPYSASADTLEVQIGKTVGGANGPSLIAGNAYALAPNYFGVGSAGNTIGSRMTISPATGESKITLYDGGFNGQTSTATAPTHYGFGISNSQLNYDVMSGASHVFYVNSKNGSGTEVFRVNSVGQAIVSSNAASAYGLTVNNISTAAGGIDVNMANTINNASFVLFRNGSTTLGSITKTAANGINYNTTSDIRLKKDIVNTHYGLADVMKIGVKDYVYKADQSAASQTGFIAQQLYTVYPVAVTKGGEDVSVNPWTVDYSKLTPLLTKAIQEEQAEIEALKAANAKLVAENAALKAGLDSKASASTLDEMQAALQALRAEVQTLKAAGTTASAK